MARINRSLLMRQEYLAGALVSQREMGTTSSGADGVLHHPPEAFHGVAVVPTRGREDMAAQRALIAVAGRVELVRPLDPAAIDAHHARWASFAAGRPPWLEIVVQFLGITVRHNLREAF